MDFAKLQQLQLNSTFISYSISFHPIQFYSIISHHVLSCIPKTPLNLIEKIVECTHLLMNNTVPIFCWKFKNVKDYKILSSVLTSNNCKIKIDAVRVFVVPPKQLNKHEPYEIWIEFYVLEWLTTFLLLKWS